MTNFNLRTTEALSRVQSCIRRPFDLNALMEAEKGKAENESEDQGRNENENSADKYLLTLIKRWKNRVAALMSL
jgi:hypothetical protein